MGYPNKTPKVLNYKHYTRLVTDGVSLATSLELFILSDNDLMSDSVKKSENKGYHCSLSRLRTE